MSIKKWILDGHPQRYHIAALFFAVVALSIAFTTTILAEDTEPSIATGSSTATTTAPIPCSYSYSDWGACRSENKRHRDVTGMSPSGCIQTSQPKTVESCNYTAPVTTTAPIPCSYSYNSWGTCQSNGKRSRMVGSVSPSGCATTTAPILTESCTYSAATTNTNTGSTSPAADQCLYTYSNWGVCQSNGKRNRSLISTVPSGCAEYTKPVLEQSCIYDTVAIPSTSVPATPTAPTTIVSSTNEETETEDTTNTTGDAVTPAFFFLNVNDGVTFRGTFEIKGQVQGAQGVEYYLVPNGSNTYKYIGSGTKISDTGWNLKFRSEEFPNGEFYLRAKIKNIYGEYGGGQRRVRIANERITITETEGIDGFVPFATNDEKKIEILKKVAEELQIPKDETEGSSPKTADQQKKHIFSYCESHPEKCFPERDSDNDGLSDIDEIRYGTDPDGADSDLDGFIDGDEVKNGFDPMKYSAGDQSDRIIFENPKVAGETKDQIYAVEHIELKEDVASETGYTEKKIRLTGKGLPNSFVTIYIYSDPIVLTVKTDSDGNWIYELDKELEDGEHEAYVAITDNTGKITGKSNPFPFVKTAQAVTVIPTVAAKSEEILPVTENRAERDILILVSIMVAALAAALAVIGLVKHRHNALKEEILR